MGRSKFQNLGFNFKRSVQNICFTANERHQRYALGKRINILLGKMGVLIIYLLGVKSTYCKALFWYFGYAYKGAFACKPFFSSVSITRLSPATSHIPLVVFLHVSASLNGIESRPRNSCLLLGPMPLFMRQCCIPFNK